MYASAHLLIWTTLWVIRTVSCVNMFQTVWSNQTGISCLFFLFAVHGNWGSWGSYGNCGAKCGGGVQERFRYCNNPAPRNGGRGCHGFAKMVRACNTHQCSSKAYTILWLHQYNLVTSSSVYFAYKTFLVLFKSFSMIAKRRHNTLSLHFIIGIFFLESCFFRYIASAIFM